MLHFTVMINQAFVKLHVIEFGGHLIGYDA